MQLLASRPDLLKTAFRAASSGTITTFRNAHGLTIHGESTANGQTLLALYVYKADETYDVVYAQVDATGQVVDILHEQEGILPTFFQSPEQTPWVSVVPYHPDKEQEISIPVFHREGAEPTKPARPFAGEYIGTLNQQAWFIDCNSFSDKKPDKLLSVTFGNGAIKKKTNIKLDLPSNNHALINDSGLHLLARTKQTLVHRSCDEKGAVQTQRELPWGLYGAYEPVSLSFQEMSFVVAATRGAVVLVSFDNQGQAAEQMLFEGYEVYSLWRGVWLSADTVLFRFTHEHGNGWFILRNQQLIEGFVQGQEPGYKSLLNDERIPLGEPSLVLAGANKTVDNGYALSFYPRTERNKGNPVVYVYSRNL
jgi:hypothetical protein